MVQRDRQALVVQLPQRLEGELGLEADFPEAIFLEMGANLEKPLTYDRIGTDDEATAIFMASTAPAPWISA